MFSPQENFSPSTASALIYFAKEPNISAKEPSISTKLPYVPHFFSRSSASAFGHLQMSPTLSQKEPSTSGNLPHVPQNFFTEQRLHASIFRKRAQHFRQKAKYFHEIAVCSTKFLHRAAPPRLTT